MQEEQEDKVASTTVEKNEDGSYTATATTESGSTGEGYSSDGIVEEGSASKAVNDAVEQAK